MKWHWLATLAIISPVLLVAYILLFAMLFIAPFSIIYFLPPVLAPFAIGILIGWILEERFKKESFFAKANGLPGLLCVVLAAIAGPVIYLSRIENLPTGIYLFNYGLITLIIFFLYYASMASGFFFRKSKYKQIWLLGPIIILPLFAVLTLLLSLG